MKINAITAYVLQLVMADWKHSFSVSVQNTAYLFQRYESAMLAVSAAIENGASAEALQDLKQDALIARATFLNHTKTKLGIDMTPGEEIVLPEFTRERLVTIRNADTGLVSTVPVLVKLNSANMPALNEGVAPL